MQALNVDVLCFLKIKHLISVFFHYRNQQGNSVFSFELCFDLHLNCLALLSWSRYNLLLYYYLESIYLCNKPENFSSQKMRLLANKWAVYFRCVRFFRYWSLLILWCYGFLKLTIYVSYRFAFSSGEINHPFCSLFWYIKWWKHTLKKLFISAIKIVLQHHFNNHSCFTVLVEQAVWHLLLSVLMPFSTHRAVLCKGRSNGGEHGKSVSSLPSAFKEIKQMLVSLTVSDIFLNTFCSLWIERLIKSTYHALIIFLKPKQRCFGEAMRFACSFLPCYQSSCTMMLKLMKKVSLTLIAIIVCLNIVCFLYLIPSLTPLFHKQFNLSYIISAARDSVSLPTLKLWFLPPFLVTEAAIESIQPYVSGNWCHWELTSEASKEFSFHSSQLSDMVCCMDVWALRTGSSERMRKRSLNKERAMAFSGITD